MASKFSKRPSVFIGSSAEGLPIAEAIQQNLDFHAECIPWSQGVFGLSTGTLASLVDLVPKLDFAVLVLTPDDLVYSRDERSASPRDNVLLEAGIFIGALGVDRTLLVLDRTAQMKVPSDLAGITPATYAPPSAGNWRSALGAACTAIRNAVEKLGKRAGPSALSFGGIFIDSAKGAGVAIRVTNDSGKELLPYVPALVQGSGMHWQCFNTKSQGKLYDGQYREHELILPGMSKKLSPHWDAAYQEMGFGVREEPSYGPMHQHLERAVCDDESNYRAYRFELRMEDSDRVLFESSAIGFALASYIRESADTKVDDPPAFHLLSEACKNPGLSVDELCERVASE